MSNFGELVLVLGDFHIPDRANVIPEKFKRMLVPNKMQHVICTGNLGIEQYEELRALAPNLHVVSGDYDDYAGTLKFPETAVVQVGQFRIGIIHGHQIIPWNNNGGSTTNTTSVGADTTTNDNDNGPTNNNNHDALARMRRKLNVDILISGHTHQNEVVSHDGYYLLNPGSITGAFSSITKNVTPSFILLAVKDNGVVCYVYEYMNGDVDVSKFEFTKKNS